MRILGVTGGVAEVTVRHMQKLILSSLPTIYIAFLIMIGLAVHFLRVKRRKLLYREKHPLPEDLKLLREPGESQRLYYNEMVEKLFINAILAALLAFELALFPLQLVVWYKADHEAQLQAFILTLVLAVIGPILFVLWLLSGLSKIRNRRSGLFGERVVGEHLNKLKTEGFFVFHDLPMGNQKLRHNIDHVVVGPTGLFVIETKAYRKRKGRPGYEDHKIFNRGDFLDFPWAESRRELGKSNDRAKQLAKLLTEALEQRIDAQPILAFPGWFIESGGEQSIVMSHKRLESYIRHHKTVQLNNDRITKIANYLDSLCRNVEY